MTQLSSSLIWKRMLLDGKRMVTSCEVRALARELGKHERRSLTYLQEEGYVCRILRGIFYVKTPNERERGALSPSIHELVARALAVKGVKRWYIGLESALKLNGMTHEFFNVEYVLTDSFRTTKVIKILEVNYQFLRRGRDHFDLGMTRKGGLAFSDPEKTVLDLAYREYLAGKDTARVRAPLEEYGNQLDAMTLGKYLARYPPAFRSCVGAIE